MCAYKLCRVEFKYWGMQSKIEKFIHDIALRKTMLRAHRQAWAWQDEWIELTMDDIRQLEKETQEALAKKMCTTGDKIILEEEGNLNCNIEKSPSNISGQEVDWNAIDKDNDLCKDLRTDLTKNNSLSKPNLNEILDGTASDGKQKLWSRSSSRTALYSPNGNSMAHFDVQMANWRMESIVRDSETSSDEEYFDAEDIEITSLPRWSSMELIPNEEETTPETAEVQEDNIFTAAHAKSEFILQGRSSKMSIVSCGGSIDTSLPATPTSSPAHRSCPTSVLIMVLHGGSILDTGIDTVASKKSDITTFRGAFESVVRQHYSSMIGRISICLVFCPSICSEALAVLSNLSPYSFQASPSAIDGVHSTYDSIPLGALLLFAISSPEYQEYVSRVICATNQVYNDFLHSEEGYGFDGQVVVIGDSVGSVLAYDALLRTSQFNSRYGSENSIAEMEPSSQQLTQSQPQSPGIFPHPNPLISISDEKSIENEDVLTRSIGSMTAGHIYRKSYSHPSESDSTFHDSVQYNRLLSAPPLRRRSSGSSDHSTQNKFDFDVSDFFMFGSSLGIVIAYRKMLSCEDKNSPPPKPSCLQVYNLFHPTDPSAVRVEPLLSARFSQLSPVNIPRYQKYPLGDGQPVHLAEYIQTYAHVFNEGASQNSYPSMGRRSSEASITSTISGMADVSAATVTLLNQKWWGTKRLDYAIYCPDGLSNFPTNALPHLFHASYWESTDVIAFILRQLVRGDNVSVPDSEGKETLTFTPSQPREKWLKKRTSVKLKNMTANHRANDVIVKEGTPQVLSSRFVYGPLDMVTLANEKVDIHIMKDQHNGEWMLLSTEITDKNGRITYVIPREKAVGYGMFPVKMVVRGDHTSVDFFLTVVPPKTECIVFSIDGSFTASMSVTGKDPKVRAGAVDVVRHWQELGYLIIYITGRPDMQQQRVMSWLSQHNFPHGLVSFADGLLTDPLRRKAEYLRHLQKEADILVHAAYGSSKDIWVYTSIGLKPDKIFIVGKVSKKHHALSTVLSDGYAAHLTDLKAHGGSRAAKGNARMVLPRGYFGMGNQMGGGLRHRHSAKRTTSYPLSAQIGERTIPPNISSKI
ncbi:protein retinal degeneration B-like isoform X2 [Centruroides sculpturatus]|uniref:protein retinal degeneration B-like isoform X2 n=1 Tax=Centruroides sculpturatus TaxID=218467 RepID=UPI000C6C9226|nr:protein retinal degeneration B-like isoform X2 [Centruroides sculpturatus]